MSRKLTQEDNERAALALARSRPGAVPVGEPVFQNEAGQVYPGSSFFVWDSASEVGPDRFGPVADVVQVFKEHFITQFWTALRKRGGLCRIRISIEWIPAKTKL